MEGKGFMGTGSGKFPAAYFGLVGQGWWFYIRISCFLGEPPLLFLSPPPFPAEGFWLSRADASKKYEGQDFTDTGSMNFPVAYVGSVAFVWKGIQT